MTTRCAGRHAVSLWDVFRKAYGLGFHRALLPAEVGGLGFEPLTQHIFLEELSWGSADFAIALGVVGFPFANIARTGRELLVKLAYKVADEIRLESLDALTQKVAQDVALVRAWFADHDG